MLFSSSIIVSIICCFLLQLLLAQCVVSSMFNVFLLEFISTSLRLIMHGHFGQAVSQPVDQLLCPSVGQSVCHSVSYSLRLAFLIL